jgi:hypothetical protein
VRAFSVWGPADPGAHMGKLRLKDDSIRFDGDIHGVLGFHAARYQFDIVPLEFRLEQSSA